MSEVGTIFIDTATKRQYQCTADITISSTLMSEKPLTYGIWKNLIGSNTVTEITPKTVILEDADGHKIVAVLVDEEIDFTATAGDIRQGMVAATDDGVTVGNRYIPTYLTTAGIKYVSPGSRFFIKLADYDLYDYSKLQALICPATGSMDDSVKCEKVVIDGNLYNVLSTDIIQEITVDSENKTIEFGINNTSEIPYLIRFFTYKEVY